MNVGCATVFKRERRGRGGKRGGEGREKEEEVEEKEEEKRKRRWRRDFSRVSYSGGHQWFAMTDRKEKAISSQGRARRKASLRSPFRIHVAIICRIYLCCALADSRCNGGMELHANIYIIHLRNNLWEITSTRSFSSLEIPGSLHSKTGKFRQKNSFDE